MGRAACGRGGLEALNEPSDTKVGNFKRRTFLIIHVKQVFRLEIPVYDADAVAIADRIDYRPYCLACFTLIITFLFDDSVE